MTKPKPISLVEENAKHAEQTAIEKYRLASERYGLGSNDYMGKPADFSQFAAALRQIGAFWALLSELSMRTPSHMTTF